MPGKRKGTVSRRAAQPTISDLPSDSPKRKDSKVEFQGHLSHASPPITNFFRPEKKEPSTLAVEVSVISDCIEPIVLKDNASTLLCETLSSLESQESDVGVIPDEPVLDNEGGEGEDTNAPTPHKMILLPPLLSPSSALSQLTLLGGQAKKATKSRRKLNPSQTANQLALSGAGSKLICCNKAGPGNADTQQPSTGTALNGSQHKLTEYFPVRRSVRKTKKTVMEERQRSLEEAVLTGKEEGLEVHNFEGKGRGVVARRHFVKGEFVVEYAGELIKMDEARDREKLYAQDQNTGCYMYYFKYRNQQYCVDATSESDRLGRLVNHSRNGNLLTKTITVDNLPRLVLIAKEDIQLGEEVTYDYGDRSKESLRYHPWLAS